MPSSSVPLLGGRTLLKSGGDSGAQVSRTLFIPGRESGAQVTGYTLDALRTHKAQQATRRLAAGPAYNDYDLICAREDGTPWPPDAFSTAFAARVQTSKMAHFRFHDLRHTHATQLLKQGVHPKIVSERLGHSNIGITLDTYSHVLPGMQEDAVAAFDSILRGALNRAPNGQKSGSARPRV